VRVWSRQAKKERHVLLSYANMNRIVQKAGYVAYVFNEVLQTILNVRKIEYFNQRRVIAEAQKDRLAQANTQAQSLKR
jgi:hypothetical protein